MIRLFSAVLLLLLLLAESALSQAPRSRTESPAAAPIPATLTEQTYPAEQVEAGRRQFTALCGFCHGLDAAGGSGGPDLTRSELVARDVRGDLIGEVIRIGRPDAEIPMPGLPDIAASDLDAIVAFVHDQKQRAESVEGGRQVVSADDVQSGDPAAGRRYFERNCSECHSASGDLAGIASRFEGLTLLRRMLNPRIGGAPSTSSTPRVSLTTAAGESFVGLLAYRDEFTIALTDASGRYRSFDTASVTFEIDDPLARHDAMLAEYTDQAMHDLVTYLHTLQ